MLVSPSLLDIYVIFDIFATVGTVKMNILGAIAHDCD